MAIVIQVNSNGITNLGNAATQDRIDRFAAGMQQAASDTFFGGGGTAYNGFASLVNGSNWLANRLQNFRGYREDQFNYLSYYEPRTPGEQSAAVATTFLMLYAGGAASARSAPSFSGFSTVTGTTGLSGEAFPLIKQGSSGGSTAFGRIGNEVRRGALTENPNRICVFCHQEASQFDHAFARARGGNTTLENTQLTCAFCNQSKGVRQFPVNPAPGYKGPFPPPWWKN